MATSISFVEESPAQRFDPLTLTRPCSLLRDGALTNAARWEALLKPRSISQLAGPLSIAAFEPISEAWTQNQTDSDDVWMISGLVQPLPDKCWAKLQFPEEFIWQNGFNRVARKSLKRANGELPELKDAPFRGLNGLWDIIKYLPEQLAFDFQLWKKSHKQSPHKVHAPAKGVYVVGDKKLLFIGKRVRIDPQNILNTESGPIILDDDVTLEPFNRIDGPAYIGQGTTLMSGKFTGGTAIGPGCKIGGEWECSVAQGFVNKAHAGFFGHGILGEWVNLGAMTANSDLKNTYGAIRVNHLGREVDTGQMKVGSFIADHTKTGIGTLIPTGATWGVGCNFFGGGMGPKHMPSFVWGSNQAFSEHKLDRMIATAEIAVERRALMLRKLECEERLSTAYRQMLNMVFDQTADERAQFLAASRP